MVLKFLWYYWKSKHCPHEWVCVEWCGDFNPSTKFKCRLCGEVRFFSPDAY